MKDRMPNNDRLKRRRAMALDYAKGRKSTADVAEKYGVTPETVRAALKEFNVPLVPYRRTPR